MYSVCLAGWYRSRMFWGSYSWLVIHRTILTMKTCAKYPTLSNEPVIFLATQCWNDNESNQKLYKCFEYPQWTKPRPQIHIWHKSWWLLIDFHPSSQPVDFVQCIVYKGWVCEINMTESSSNVTEFWEAPRLASWYSEQGVLHLWQRQS